MNAAAGVACLALAASFAVTSAPTRGVDGNALLRESASRHPLPRSYAVPIHFHVHLRKPIGITLQADAISYFQAPHKQALVITSLPRMLSRSIGRSYGSLDTVPQGWSVNYRVTDVRPAQRDGEPVYELDGQPNAGGDIDHATFVLAREGLAPIGATWFFHDGSTVRLTVRNERVERYLLPAHEDLNVEMSRFTLDADGDNGPYELDAAIPDDVFAP